MDPRLVQGAVLLVLGYLIGSLPSGVIVARLTGGIDPRTVGSGRTGGTNALRAMGPARGLGVGLMDVAKGALPVALAAISGAGVLFQALAGVAAVLGACWSVFLRFRGGRGVATGIGAMLIVQPLAALIGAPMFFAVIWLSRYVSLGSLLGSAFTGGVVAVLVWLGYGAPATVVYAVGAVALIWLAHADNIGRLLRGEERKFEPRHRPSV